MSKGRKTGGRNFEKGVSGNPAGRPPLPEDIKKMRSVTTEEAIRVLHKYANYTREQIKAAVNDPETPVMELMVASVMSKTIQEGDAYRWNMLMDRAVGKIPNKIDLETRFKSELSGKSIEELKAIAEELLK